MRPFSTCLFDSIDFATLNFAEVSYGTTRAISNWDKLTRVCERTSTLRHYTNDNHPAPASTEAIAAAARQRYPLHSSPLVHPLRRAVFPHESVVLTVEPPYPLPL